MKRWPEVGDFIAKDGSKLPYFCAASWYLKSVGPLLKPKVRVGAAIFWAEPSMGVDPGSAFIEKF